MMVEFDTYKTCEKCPYRHYGCHDTCEGKRHRDEKRKALKEAERREKEKYYIRWTRQV